jgi:AmmeMemoRadiSam system protein A
MPLSPCAELSADEQVRLLEMARQSILDGLEAGRALQLDLARLSDNLLIKSAVFITLMRSGELRGCIGSLQPVEPLAQAVANSAFNAAFHDRRFSKMQAAEVDKLKIEISVLSEMEVIEVDSRQALLSQLQPGVDGLLLEDQGHRSTFLPKVWEKIPSPEMFVDQLMLKAGLPAGHWSQTIRLQRYHTLTFGEN